MDMHQSHGGTDLLPAPEPSEPEPEPRPGRRARRPKGFVVVLVAAALVLLCANGAVSYLGHRISLDEQTARVEPLP
ncbi:hypothetical protein APR04_002043 [Promicromonospora umidemergens]|uniref:Uncharacterized protein n=1 Tax=Promicromonospora umidemergens TaxID=629679 RepID=A0ABP8WPT7_9MICO|nr:hypothetical protein [Promicromonospora umidemergens]MCP2283140.1 hypothetical protein [Promicromonospora umidemergens]